MAAAPSSAPAAAAPSIAPVAAGPSSTVVPAAASIAAAYAEPAPAPAALRPAESAARPAIYAQSAPQAPAPRPPDAQPARAAPAVAAAAAAAEAPAEGRQIADPEATWRAVVAEAKAQKKDWLANALAHGRLISCAPGKVRLGYGPADGMYRRQAERMLQEAQAILSKYLGTSTALVLESVADEDEASVSIAEQENQRVRAREGRILRDSRENSAVLLAMKILGGTVENVRILEEEAIAEFANAPEENEEAET